jgi:hypothetical protein
MGFNTTIVILNDAISELTTDPGFGERLYRGISGFRVQRQNDISIGRHINACHVVSMGHADITQVVAVGGNCGTLLGYVDGWEHHRKEDQERILRGLADQLGFHLRRKAKP